MLKLRIYNAKTSQELESVELVAQTNSKDFLVGRAPHCDVVLNHFTLSLEHGKFRLDSTKYHFIDLGSANGSKINDLAIEPLHAVILSVTDIIQLGDLKIVVEEISITDGSGISKDIENREESQTPSLLNPIPSQYMPVACVEMEKIERWKKGDLELQCAKIIEETQDVKTFCFVTNPPKLFTYKPGQFITLAMEINGEEVLRSYSISSSPSRPHSLEITVKRVPSPDPQNPDIPQGLVSNWLHDFLKVGDRIQARGAFGKFTCFEYPSQKLLFLSAGSGITPMMSMSRWIYDTHADCDVVFFHCARSPQDIIYHHELELMAERLPKFQLALTTTRSVTNQSWIGLRGRLTSAMLQMIAPDWSDRTVFVCGSESFMQSTKELLDGMGFPMQQYHEESFGGSKKKSSNSTLSAIEVLPTFGIKAWLGNLQLPQNAIASSATNQVKSSKLANRSPLNTKKGASQKTATIVMFSKSGKEVPCDGEESILEVAERVGVKIRSSCRVGSCGTCKKVKLEGDVRMEGYDAEALETTEINAGYILCCVAFPQGKVVIDV